MTREELERELHEHEEFEQRREAELAETTQSHVFDVQTWSTAEDGFCIKATHRSSGTAMTYCYETEDDAENAYARLMEITETVA